MVDPKVVDDLVDGQTESPPIKQGPVEFVLALVRGESAEVISRRIGEVADLSQKHSAVLYTVTGPLVAMAFGSQPWFPASAAARLALVNDLLTCLGENVKVVHGGCTGHVGLFGSLKSTANYTFLVPRFDAVLGILARLEFGRVEEFAP